MSQEADRAFIRNFIFVIIALAVSGIIFAILGNKIAGNVTDSGARDQLRAQLRAELQPVGHANTASEASEPGLVATTAATAKGASDAPSGQQVVERVCSACHATGVMGAPKIGSKEAWKPRAKAGLDTLVQHALQGYGKMPPQGGTVSAAEARAAIKYMVVEKTGIELK